MVLAETVLLVFILYLVFGKKPKATRSELTDQDIDELVAEWKPVEMPGLKRLGGRGVGGTCFAE